MASVKLNGKDYPLAWGNLAKMRYSGLPESTRRMGGGVDLSVMVWACIAIKPNPFETWEHVAEAIDIDSADTLREAVNSLFSTEPEAEKKSDSVNGPSPASASG